MTSTSSAEQRPYARAVEIGALAVVLVAALVLVGGWVLDVRALRTVIPGAVGMKALTAALLALGGIALVLLAREDASPRRVAVGRVAAALPGVIGALVIGQYAFGWELGIDEWPFVDADGRAADIKYPGRFAPTTGICFLLLSSALLSLDARRGGSWRPSELIALPIALVSVMSLIGYAYSIPAFYGPASAAKMAVHTAACFVVLAVGILLARPHGKLLALATTTDPGGVMLRRLAPVAAIAPLVLGWLHLRTVGAWNLFAFEVGTWWLTAVTATGLVLMICLCASSLSRADRTRRALEGRLYDLANHDQLTGLANRRRFDDELAAFIAYGRRYGRPGALVVVDLDGFKQVNDRLGHLAGDALLAAVAARLVGAVRTTDLVARLGGDEFAVILREIDAADAERVAAKLVAAVGEVDVEVETGSLGVTASAGVAHVSDFAAADAERLLGWADASMYRAKGGGGNASVTELLDSTRVPALA